MALNASKIKSKKSFDRPPALESGTYPARLVQIISFGLQPQRPHKGVDKEPQQELHLTYELLDEFMLDKDTGKELTDKPRWISETFPLHSLDVDLAKSTKRYLAIDPTKEHGGDWAALVGELCVLTIVQRKFEDKVYENVQGISAMRAKDAARAGELVNEPKVFDIDEPDMEIFGSLPQWMQDKMTDDNLEFAGSALDVALNGAGAKKETASTADEPKPNDEDDW